MVGLVLLRRRRRTGPRLLHAHRAAPERGRHRGGARHLASRAGISAGLRARDAEPACDRGGAAGVRLRAPARAVGAAHRRGRAAVRARRAHRDRPRRVPQVRCRQAALHRLGRAVRVRVRPDRRRREPTTTSSPARSPGCSRWTDSACLAGRGMRDHSWGVRDWQRRAVVALVRHGRRPGELPDGEQRGNRARRRDGRRLPDERRRDRRRSPPARPTSELDPELGCQRRFEAHATGRPGPHAVLEGARSRSRRCASAATAASRT